MRRHTVLLAEDHAIVTDGLARILREADFDVVGAVRDGQHLLDAARLLRPDLIITDVSMPRLTGLDVLARRKTEHFEGKVIVLTMHHDADLAIDTIRSGASGFILRIGWRRAPGCRSTRPRRSGVHHASGDERAYGARGPPEGGG